MYRKPLQYDLASLSKTTFVQRHRAKFNTETIAQNILLFTFWTYYSLVYIRLRQRKNKDGNDFEHLKGSATTCLIII